MAASSIPIVTETISVSMSSYHHLLAPFPPNIRGKIPPVKPPNRHHLWEIPEQAFDSKALSGDRGPTFAGNIILRRGEALGPVQHQESHFQRIKKCFFLPPTFSSKKKKVHTLLPCGYICNNFHSRNFCITSHLCSQID